MLMNFCLIVKICVLFDNPYTAFCNIIIIDYDHCKNNLQDFRKYSENATGVHGFEIFLSDLCFRIFLAKHIPQNRFFL